MRETGTEQLPPFVPVNGPKQEKTTNGRGFLRALPSLLCAALAAGALMFLFEALKYALFPHIGIWQSHSLTIGFSALVAAAISWRMFCAKERARNKARKSEMEFGAVFEQSVLGIALLNAEGRVLRANQAAQRMLALSEAEIQGKHFTQFTHPDDVPAAANAFEELVNGRREGYHAHRRYVRSDGQVICMQLTVSALHGQNGKLQSAIAIMEDVTEQRRAEAQLAEALDFNRKVISTATTGIVVFNGSGQCVIANEAAARIIGGTVPELMKQNFRQLESWRASGLLELAEKTLLTQTAQEGEFHLLTTFGREIRALCHFNCFGRNNEPHLLFTVHDITARKKAEDALARERSLLRTLIDNLPDCIYVKDTAGRKTLANPADLKNLRCKTEAEAIGRTDFDLFPRETAEKFWADDQKVIQGQPVVDREESFLDEEGVTRWLLTSKLPLRGENGEIIGLIGIGRDITARKQAEAALARERSLLGMVINNLPDRIYAKDSVGRFVLNNRAHASALGAKLPAEMQGKSDYDYFPAELAEQYFADEQKIVKTGEPIINQEQNNETRGDASDDKRWTLVSKVPWRDEGGNVVGTIGISRDITTLKQAMEKIHQQAALLDEATDAIWVADADERISYWNKGAERIYGWSADEAIGKNPVALFNKGIATPRLRECINTVKEHGAWSGELEQFTKDGKTVVVQGHYNASRDERGVLKSVFVIASDATEAKKLETQLLRAQRMESLGTLAGGMAHDLNNILAPILISVQLLKEKMTDPIGQTVIGSLEANIERGAKLIQQVLTFGRGVQGERIPVQPARLIREIEQIVRGSFPKSVEFESHCPADSWTVIGDSTQLQQVLLNLCVNARDAMPKGGNLSIRVKNAVLNEIDSGINPRAKPGPYAIIEVTDAGTGMTKEIQDRMFEPFFTTKAPGLGTGLGLSTSLGIIRSHGGFIHCYSELGKGSTFRVYLPASPAAPVARKPAGDAAELPRGHDELVLLVDDEEAILEVAQRTLEHFGYRVLSAANGAEAVSLYSSRCKDIDVVITDMAMPGMDGPAAITVLRSINPAVKIIGSSGLDGYGAENARLNYFIPKPYTAKVMLTMLQQILAAGPQRQ